MPNTLYHNLKVAAQQYPDRIALMHKVRGTYKSVSYRELMAQVNSVAESLRRLGLEKADSVGILSHNRPEWAIADFAVMKIGCIVVPIYPTSPASYLRYVATDSRIKLLFVENEELLEIARSLPDYRPLFQIIVVFDGVRPQSANEILVFDDLRKARAAIDGDAENVSADDIATVVYTSGTTGNPKGVILTHGNIVTNAISVQKRFGVTCEEVELSYLPLCHMFERTCGHYAMLFAGAAIAYAENSATVAEDVRTVRPTLLLAVPSVIEKAYHHVVTSVNRGSAFKRIMVTVSMRVLNSRANLSYRGARIPLYLRTISALCNRYVASKFRQLGGGRLRIVASGGAPLDRKIAKVYHILGFNIVEGYGLTECSPIVSCHTLTERRLGTAGKPLDGVDVRIGINQEILVRGPNVMRGYLNRAEDTAKTIDADGWFHTGDQGSFDAQGNLSITGRIKDVIVLSTGEKVPASTIESKILRSEYVSQAVLLGDRRKFLAALIVPDRQQVETFAKSNGIPYTDYTYLLSSNGIQSLMRQQLIVSTEDTLPHEKVKAFSMLPDPFTVENGLMTPTLKIRRDMIVERYRDIIECLFESVPAASRSRTLEAEHAHRR